MARWLIKSAIHRLISWLPHSHRWNEWMQEHLTHSMDLSYPALTGRLAEANRLLDDFARVRGSVPESFRVFEVGTGWYPTIPVALHLCGAEAQWTYDIAPLVRSRRVRRMAELFQACHEKGELPVLLPRLQPARRDQLLRLVAEADRQPPATWLARLGIHYHAQDARANGLPTGSVDLVFSLGVLHHIPPAVLADLLREFRRVLKPEGVMIHSLMLDDQFALFDPGISRFNFLRYTERQWRWRSSPLIWANRLRIGDYRRLFREAGFEVVREDNQLARAEDLARVPLAPEFRHHPPEDLLVARSWVVARPARTAATATAA